MFCRPSTITSYFCGGFINFLLLKVNIFSESSALILQGFQTPVSKNHPLFLQKRLTNHQKFAAKPIDYSLFQSTGGDFYVTC